MADASVSRYRTPSGEPRWKITYRLGGRQSSRAFTDEKAAKYWLNVFQAAGPAQALALLDAADAQAAPVVTIRELVEDHVTHLTGITAGTRESYRREAARDIYPTLGDLPVAALDVDRVKAWVNHLEHAGGKSGRGLSGKTIANRHGLLSAAAATAVSRGLLPANPARGVRLPWTDVDEPIFLTAKEAGQLVEAMDVRYRPFLRVMLGTALRWQEITALRVRDVDLGARPSIRVAQAWKDVDSGPMELGTPKSKAGRRTIPVPRPSTLLDDLEAAVKGKGPDDLVFTSPRGLVLRNGTFTGRQWAKALAAVEARHGWKVRPSPHDMRHTAISFMLAAGADIMAVSRIAGHEKFSTTVDVYGHLVPGATDRAMAALASTLDRLADDGAQRVADGIGHPGDVEPVADEQEAGGAVEEEGAGGH